MLAWDGLRFPLPRETEAVELLPGYLRLAGPDQGYEFRFGPEKRAFDPARDGRRLQRGAGLPVNGVERCQHRAARSLPGRLYGGERLFVYRFTGGGLVALLFARPASVEEVVALVGAMTWTPPEGWREWRCLDLAFASPPHMVVQGARLVPGTFTITLKKGGATVNLVRLAAADVHLAAGGLAGLAEQLAAKVARAKIMVSGLGDRLDFTGRGGAATALTAILPWLGTRVRGSIAHDRKNNRILLAVERGRGLPEDDYRRMVESYVAPEQG